MTPYCNSPWIGLFINQNNVKSCCAGNWNWGDLSKTPLEEILNNPRVQQLRNDLRNNVENDYCVYCRQIELSGGESQRKYYENFTLTNDVVQNNSNFDLQALDIRWSNLCNLNCAYCNPGWSSSWQKVMNIPLDPVKYQSHNSILNYIQTNGEKIKATILAGGEPLIHKQNLKLLENLPNDAKIDIITNLSIKLSNSLVYKKLLTKQVNWAISMDNVYERFEYVRHGAKFNQIYENLHKIKSVNNFSVMLFPVYNFFNCTRLIEFYNFANQLNLPIHWQMLTQPNFLNVLLLSDSVKKLAKDEIIALLNSSVFHEYNTKHHYNQGTTFFNNILKLLEEKNHSFSQELKTYIDTYEQSYTKNIIHFFNLWPEFYNNL